MVKIALESLASDALADRKGLANEMADPVISLRVGRKYQRFDLGDFKQATLGHDVVIGPHVHDFTHELRVQPKFDDVGQLAFHDQRELLYIGSIHQFASHRRQLCCRKLAHVPAGIGPFCLGYRDIYRGISEEIKYNLGNGRILSLYFLLEVLLDLGYFSLRNPNKRGMRRGSESTRERPISE